jgi:hypothetical protein
MTTFSQLVDSILLETRRPDLKAEVIRYANQSIRECFFEPERNTVVFMRSAYREALVIPTVDTGASWDVPNPGVFQGVGAVRYDSVGGVYAKMLNPGKRFDSEQYVFQHAGDRLVFKGYGGVGGRILIAYYEFCRAHKYYEVAERPASYDVDLGWSYLPAFDIDETTRMTARIMVTNWLLMGWNTVLEEGLRAKIYKRLSDDARQRVSYSLWMQQRKGIISTEQAELVGVT